MSRPPRVVFVTGTGTGVGKTVLTTLLARYLVGVGSRVAALKPLCSGGRDDARALREAAGGRMGLGDVNPWAFRAALSPLIAARREGRSVRLQDVVARVDRVGAGMDWILVEGAGGLLSPLGEGFDARDLIRALRARTVVVAANRLGALNEVLLTLEALPAVARRRSALVLVEPVRSTLVGRTNVAFLRGRFGPGSVHVLPRVADWRGGAESALPPGAKRACAGLWRAISGGS